MKLGFWIAIGVAVGAANGVATNHLALGLSKVVGIGTALCLITTAKPETEGDDRQPATS
jgi:hypothetical protein